MTIKVIKNVLTESTHKNILSVVQADDVCWYKGQVLDSNTKDYQFSHTLYLDHNVTSTLFDTFKPLFRELQIVAFHRLRLNCNIRQTENRILGGFHIDIGDEKKQPHANLTTAIYYLNTTDGKTLIKENNKVKEIECEANSVIIFPNTFEHTGTTHTDKQFRYVLNLNYFS